MSPSRIRFALVLLAVALPLSAMRPGAAATAVKPKVLLTASTDSVVMEAHCEAGYAPSSDCKPTEMIVHLSAIVTDDDPENPVMEYRFDPSAGTVRPDGGPNATWDLAGVKPGKHKVTVEVFNASKKVASASVSVRVGSCDCTQIQQPACPTIVTESRWPSVRRGVMQQVRVNVTGPPPRYRPTYNWTVSGGVIVGGQGTQQITISTNGVRESRITAIVLVGGAEPGCPTNSSVSFGVTP